jgi:hypothetical protein
MFEPANVMNAYCTQATQARIDAAQQNPAVEKTICEPHELEWRIYASVWLLAFAAIRDWRDSAKNPASSWSDDDGTLLAIAAQHRCLTYSASHWYLWDAGTINFSKKRT